MLDDYLYMYNEIYGEVLRNRHKTILFERLDTQQRRKLKEKMCEHIGSKHTKYKQDWLEFRFRSCYTSLFHSFYVSVWFIKVTDESENLW